MTTIVTRASNGAALSWTQGDQNLINLNNDKIEDIVEDTTPQLGGNLDVNGNSIVSVSNGNIQITPNGTGSIVLDGLNWPQADGTANYVLKTNGSGQLSWVAQTAAFDPASPGAIGATTPAAGTFNQLLTPTTARSSSAWTNTGINLRLQARTYTDTSSSGTISASHINAVAAPTMASTNTITVTDAANLFVAAPTAGTNTTITNAWALLTSGNAKITGNLNVTANLNANGANAVHSLSPSGTGTVTISPAGALTINPTTASTINNTSIGQSTAAAGSFTNLTVSGTVNAGGSNGTTGQVLQSTGTGVQWATASGGGTPVAILRSTYTYQEFTNMSVSATTLPTAWSELQDISNIVTVSGNNFTLGAGTYLLEYCNNYNTHMYITPSSTSVTTGEMTLSIYNSTDSTSLGITRYSGQKFGGTSSGSAFTANLAPHTQTAYVTIGSSKTFNIRYDITSGSGYYSMKYVYTYELLPTMKITKLA